MDLSQLSALLAAHKWLAAVALTIGAIVRILKSDTPIPITIPAQWRAWLAIGLGAVAGVLDALVTGTPALQAIVQGLAAAALAITAHDTVVEGLRGGRELFSAKPTLPSSKTNTDGGGNTSGTAAGLALVLGVASLTLSQPACSSANRDTVKTAVDIASISCVVLRAMGDDGDVQEICATEAELAPLVKGLLMARLRTPVCWNGGDLAPVVRDAGGCP